MSYNSTNNYKIKRIKVTNNFAEFLEEQKRRTNLSIPKISNDLGNYLKSVGWELQPVKIKVKNGKGKNYKRRNS